ncbi:MAG TPA: hypothetical protein VGP82_26080 [Ktedonobacterales bacterium]|jgi:hypothetical protein|nr:hypothetical protein [Ktedonobacterales bacterium]
MSAAMSLGRLSWARLRKLAQQMADTSPASEFVKLAEQNLTSCMSKVRQFGTYLLGFAEMDRAASLAELRRLVVPDEDSGGARGAGSGVR